MLRGASVRSTTRRIGGPGFGAAATLAQLRRKPLTNSSTGRKEDSQKDRRETNGEGAVGARRKQESSGLFLAAARVGSGQPGGEKHQGSGLGNLAGRRVAIGAVTVFAGL